MKRFAYYGVGVAFALLAISCLLFSPAVAQDYRAKVQGVVTDSSQAVVSGAKVTLHNDKTGVDSVRTTNVTGNYVFDFVEPGAYTVTVELEGFSKFVQQGVAVLVRGDVTVNAQLTIGQVSEAVTVQAEAVSVQFNTSTMELTVDRKMLMDLPVMQRNPFTLALLDPAVVNRYWDVAHRNPFYMWSSSQIDVGGNTTTKNDLLIDGSPVQIGVKGSYAPPMDAVQEFSVQQNSVDAEFGHSAGGIMSVGMKSGTNEIHGTTYYFGRNPAINARTNSVTNTPNLVRNHIWGVTVGNPIIKNRLFAFTAYEGWRSQEPNQTFRTMPTDLERTGDFSKSLNVSGGLRTIYDPWTTQLDASGKASRQPFPGNMIPGDRIDPTAARFMQDIWKPNNPGDDLAGTNNFKIGYSWPQKYMNFSERVDYNITDNWKVFVRYSRVKTTLDQTQYVNSPAMPNDNGGLMNNRNVAGDTVYTLNPTTVLNFRMGFSSLEDDYDAPRSAIGEQALSQFWPNNPWYSPYVGEMPAVYYPLLNVGGGSYGKGGYWYQHPRHWTWDGSLRKVSGIHSWKTGFSHRRHMADGIFPNLMGFNFYPAHTAETFQAPDVKKNGSDWASFLLGSIDNNSYARTFPFQYFRTNYYGAFFHDDIKLSRRITLNLGIRYEYENAPYDERDRFSRNNDLTNPIPEFQANPPVMPAEVLAVRKTQPVYNGAWIFTEPGNRGLFDSPKNILMPRAGIAIRLDDKTAIRGGFARYVIPPVVTQNTLSSGAHMPLWGFSAETLVEAQRQGVPSARLSEPFPAANPLVLPAGKTRGRYTNLGDNSPSFYDQDIRLGVNDRLNISLQRALPGQIHFDFTFFMNFGRDLPYNKLINLSDPSIEYAILNEWDRQVTNPFYQYLTPDKFPGALRNQRTVSVGRLTNLYPQYGTSMTQFSTDGVENRYKAFQFRVQRAYSAGYSFLFAYNYNQERNLELFNELDRFNDKFTWIDGPMPRHRFSVAGSYDLPFGRGRQYLNNINPILNHIIGGWQTSHMLLANSGPPLRWNLFSPMVGPAETPEVYRERNRWFDISGFSRLPAHVNRTSPWQYPGLNGPKYWNLDSTLSKTFQVKEDLKVEFRFETYNTPNAFVPTNPQLSVTNAAFGRTQSQQNRGRESQYSIRIIF
ncbi:MAG: TonB-dependent receptor [Bryobacteraceae bacterium]|nr:TonB-dependent receptor [Bryobacteraceae bacterium]